MKMVKALSLTLLLFAMATSLFSAEPVGSSKAKVGGTFRYNLSGEQPTLHPLRATDFSASWFRRRVYDTLLMKNPETDEWISRLAESYTVSKDGLTYEFKIRKGIKWHDGKELTARDVKFTFDAIVDPGNKYKTAHMKPYLENIKSADVKDDYTIVFHVKSSYHGNFFYVANMEIVPKHIYENPTPKQDKDLNKTMIGSGPYKFQEWQRGKYLRLVRNDDWFGFKLPEYRGIWNFAQILVRFIGDSNAEMIRLEKGELDLVALGPEEYERKTSGPKWGKEIFKVAYENSAPRGYGFVGMNQNHIIFKDRTARKAFAMLFNRDLMIKKFLYGHSEKATGPVFLRSPYANKDVKPIEFDPEGALKLLRDNGWADTDGDLILDKKIDGRKVSFSFTILEPLKDFEKYLTIVKEDAKQIGVDVNIKIVEWNTFVKKLDEREFDAVRLAWGPAENLDWDPKQIWHSDSIKNEGSNFIGYSNSTVDKLIDDARAEMNVDKRKVILKKVFKQIADDVPYVFLFNSKEGFYAHSKRINKVKDSFKYAMGYDYWWMSAK